MATATATTSAVVAIVAVVPVGMVQMVVGRERHPGPVPGWGRTPRVRPPRRTGMGWIHGWLVFLFLGFLNRYRFFALLLAALLLLSSTNLCPPVFGLKVPLATHCTVHPPQLTVLFLKADYVRWRRRFLRSSNEYLSFGFC